MTAIAVRSALVPAINMDMQTHPGSAVPPLRLDINRAVIGAERAKDIFLLCRAYAQHLEPDCFVEAIYEDHERVGWWFTMNGKMNAMRLAIHHRRVMDGRRWWLTVRPA